MLDFKYKMETEADIQEALLNIYKQMAKCYVPQESMRTMFPDASKRKTCTRLREKVIADAWRFMSHLEEAQANPSVLLDDDFHLKYITKWNHYFNSLERLQVFVHDNSVLTNKD